VGLVPSIAAAHPLVDEGKRLMQRAEFDAALEAFARAEEAEDLAVGDLTEMLAARCLLYLATGDADALQRDLESLVSIDPEWEFGAEAPPELPEAFAAIREESPGRIGMRVSARAAPGGIEVVGEAQNDLARVGREVRVFVETEGTWRRATESFVPTSAGQSVRYYGELIGPGGAVLARDGTRSEPKTSASALAGEAAPIAGGGGGGGGFPWLWVGVGAAAIAAGVVAVLLLAGGGENGTRPDPPIVIGF
jgi:hypothetical protein